MQQLNQTAAIWKRKCIVKSSLGGKMKRRECPLDGASALVTAVSRRWTGRERGSERGSERGRQGDEQREGCPDGLQQYAR